jgi:hypothetical protein
MESSNGIKVRGMYRLTVPFFFTLIILVFSFNFAYAGVTVFDDVVPVNKAVKLKALTKGRFFSEGGKLVTFYVGEQKIGTTLSGGDGYAFMKYTPSSPGIINLKVETDNETSEGAILAASKKDKLIVIEIESTLFESILSLRPVKGSNEIVQQISKSFRILYVTSLIGTGASRKWLRENDFPMSPVFKWNGVDQLNDLKERGIELYAIIASPEIISEASDINKRFSFKETEDGTEVKDWDDLLKMLDVKQ